MCNIFIEHRLVINEEFPEISFLELLSSELDDLYTVKALLSPPPPPKRGLFNFGGSRRGCDREGNY